MSDWLRECCRKAFHMLSFAYLAAYWLLGYPRVLSWMAAWTALVVLAETARLRSPALNDALFSVFAGIERPEERGRYSGIFHTTVGAFLLFLGFGGHPRIVAAAIGYVALGDAVAALGGKLLGRHRLFSSRKTLEGSLCCFAACLLVGWVLGLDAGAAFSGALAATVIECFPTTRYFNDNLWMPVGTAVVLRVLAWLA